MREGKSTVLDESMLLKKTMNFLLNHIDKKIKPYFVTITQL